MADVLKRCFKCGALKPLSEFYAHPEMGDGHLGKCKACTKRDVRRNYSEKREHYHQYDRQRTRSEQRKAARKRYRAEAMQRQPHKWRARQAVGNAIRDGRLKRQPCEVCGDAKAEAHHPDYPKPLEVRWLCFVHHREAHGQRPSYRKAG